MTAGVLPGGVAGRKIEKTCIKPVYAYTTKRGMPIQACICLYNRMGNAYIKPIYAYITKWGKPISSLYMPISRDGECLYQDYICLYHKMAKTYIKPI